ncbi:cupin superfamily protein, partial [Helicosporidium sp. ATCC 50920]
MQPVPHLDALGWLMHPTPSESWWRDDFERRAVLVSRPFCRSYFANLFVLADFESILKRERLQYGLDLDVARYDGAVRETLNSNGGEACEEHATVDPDVARRRFELEGCSLRLLHPQRFDARVRALVSALESQTGCVGGCNLYLTPPGSQGFAPHWDDVDAFVLQLHGEKTWRLYAAPDSACVLPRRSSVDFPRETLGPCLLERTLRPGDVLYLPRGLVHEARAEVVGEGAAPEPSLHATVSAHQRWTWADLLERAVSLAVTSLAASCQSLRKTLP